MNVVPATKSALSMAYGCTAQIAVIPRHRGELVNSTQSGRLRKALPKRALKAYLME